MPLPASLAALSARVGRNDAASKLGALDSPANVSALDPVFAVNPHGSAAEMASADANAGNAETAMGDSPSIQALRALSGFRREDAAADQAASDADLYSGNVARRALAGAGVENRVGDVLSEGKYGRETLPYAEAAHQRDDADAQTQALMRYIQPAQISAQGAVTAAQARAQGVVGAEQEKSGQAPLHAWLNSIVELIKSGKMPSPEDAAKLRALMAPGGAGSPAGSAVR